MRIGRIKRVIHRYNIACAVARLALKLPLLINCAAIEDRQDIALGPHGLLRLIKLNTRIFTLKRDTEATIASCNVTYDIDINLFARRKCHDCAQ